MSPFRRFSNITAKTKQLLLQELSPKSRPSLASPLFKFPNTNPFLPSSPIPAETRTFCCDSNASKKLLLIFTEKSAALPRSFDDYLNKDVLDLADELVAVGSSDSEKFIEILNARGAFLLKNSVFFPLVELLIHLRQWPNIGIEVFNWRRKQVDSKVPIMPDEYGQAITLAGRMKNLKGVNLAFELFWEASNREVLTVSVYNALMAAYMYNGLADRSLSLFENLKKDPNCRPTIVTFNILLSIFGRSVMVEEMEAVMEVMKDYDVIPNTKTYNTLIAGYVTAWMWDDVEKILLTMQGCSIQPNTSTYLLMLRAYALAGNLEKMEGTYELVKDHVNEKYRPLIRSMICAYCKSSKEDRVKKVEALLRLLPEEEYRPWLNVLLIRLYAQEDLVEGMESNIKTACERNTSVTSFGVMRSVITTYFRCNAMDKLTNFVKLAELSGWRLCRSLYHCKMVMYGLENRLDEMESVLDEMDNSYISPTKKTFIILYKAYSKFGPKSKVDIVMGIMFKQGFGIPLDASTY